MLDSSYVTQLYQYHYWANHKVLSAAAHLSSDQFYSPQGCSWGSVHAVLVHMAGAEWIWLNRWRGVSPPSLPGPDQLPDLPSIRERWQSLESEMMAFISTLDTPRLHADVVYQNTRGETFRLPLWQLMVHVVNHATHHRGELAAMFALMGVTHEEDDLLYYFLHAGGQRDL